MYVLVKGEISGEYYIVAKETIATLDRTLGEKWEMMQEVQGKRDGFLNHFYDLIIIF
jgi:phosphoenolpyruvate synthase/pyruvate phosphate dikinase